MQFEVMRCSAFMYMQRYMEFILDNYSELNIPYPFNVSLSYLSSPILLDGEVFLALDDENEVIGAISYIYGTADQNYSNREVIQFQIAYLSKPYRTSSVFLLMLQLISQYLVYIEDSIEELRFWSKPDLYLERIVNKRMDCAIKHYESIYGSLHEYRIPFAIFQQYTSQFHQEKYY